MALTTGAVKVARIIARLNIGGPSVHVMLLTRGLEPAFRTMLICGREPEHEGSMRYLGDQYGVEPTVIDELGPEISPLRDIRSVWRLYRLFRREKPLIVHTHTSKAGAVGRLAARLAGVPVVVHSFHGHVFHSYFGTAKTAVFKAIERWLARWTDRVIVLSRTQYEEIASLKVVPEDKLVIVPLGLDSTRLRGPVDQGIRRKWGLAGRGPYGPPLLVGIVGRLTAIKDHHMFLQAASRLLSRRKSAMPGTATSDSARDVFFVVIGDGELRGELEETARRLGIWDRVRFTGWERDMVSVYAALDVVALTSRNEGTPLTLIEAMFVGKPVVATDVGGVRDVVAHGETGFLVPPGDVQRMVEYLELILSDDSLRRDMGIRAQRKAERQYGAERLVSDIHRLYRELLEEKGLVADSLSSPVL